MLKKLYFHTHEGRSYDFDIVATTKDGSLEILKDNGYRVRLSGYIRKFEVDDEKQVITARYKN